MPGHTSNRLRLLAALVAALEGAGRVASLWSRELNFEAVIALCLGATYLVIALGLAGRSRFSLFIAIAVAGTTSILMLYHWGPGDLHALRRLLVGADTIIVLCCVGALWQTRGRRSA